MDIKLRVRWYFSYGNQIKLIRSVTALSLLEKSCVEFGWILIEKALEKFMSSPDFDFLSDCFLEPDQTIPTPKQSLVLEVIRRL